MYFITQPWHWAVSGSLIAFTMVLMLFFGEKFGVSSTMRSVCAIGGAGKKWEFFNFDWRSQIWNLFFVLGAFIGGFIATQWLSSPEPVQISQATIAHLQNLGISTPQTLAEGSGYLPDVFSFSNLLTVKGFILIVVGSFLVGFGARYAGGCTSGHAISGLSSLQLPSLLAVIGFFIGGLAMTYLFMPLILLYC